MEGNFQTSHAQCESRRRVLPLRVQSGSLLEGDFRAAEPTASVVPDAAQRARGPSSLRATAPWSYRLYLSGGAAPGRNAARPPATPWRTLLRESVQPLQCDTDRVVHGPRPEHLNWDASLPSIRGGWPQKRSQSPTIRRRQSVSVILRSAYCPRVSQRRRRLRLPASLRHALQVATPSRAHPKGA